MRQNNSQTTCPMAGADAYSKEIIMYVRKKLQEKYGSDKPLRAFHAKTIGLVKARFIVKKDLEDWLKVGLFKEPIEYDAWIRFTNSSATPTDDSKKAVRGMAIKVLLPDSGVQNIILSTSSFFFSGDPSLQLEGVKLILGNAFERIASMVPIAAKCLGPALAFMKTNLVTPNILEELYYSGTPYAYGKNKAIKWLAKPLKTITTVLPKAPEKNYLQLQLAKDLSEEGKEEISFALCVQFQDDELTEPIEDASVIWKTDFYEVATIVIPKQDFDSKDRLDLDEDMNFSPGSFIPEHEPLGSLNQIRMRVYDTLAKDRSSYPNGISNADQK